MKIGSLTRHRCDENSDSRVLHQMLTLTQLVNRGGLPITVAHGGGDLPQPENYRRRIPLPPIQNVTHHLHLRGTGGFCMSGRIDFNQPQRFMAAVGEGCIQGLGSIVIDNQHLEYGVWRIEMRGRMTFSGHGEMTDEPHHLGDWANIEQGVDTLQGECTLQGVGQINLTVEGDMRINRDVPLPLIPLQGHLRF